MYRNATFLRFVKFITLVFEVPLFDHKYLQYSLLKRDDVSCQQRADVITSHLISLLWAFKLLMQEARCSV